MKVLMVGNSYSFDISRLSLRILKSAGITDYTLCHAYRGDSSFNIQYELGTDGGDLFGYNHSVCGTMVCNLDELKSLEYIVKSDKWDIITFQQRSFCAGSEKYNGYDKIHDLVFGWCENTPKTGIIVPWAYAKNCTHKEFEPFEHSQQKMYGLIMEDTSRFLEEKAGDIDCVIPAGIAVQTAREMFPEEEDYSRDGIHLNLKGQYVAALAAMKTLFGADISSVRYIPEGINDTEAADCKIAVGKAINYVI